MINNRIQELIEFLNDTEHSFAKRIGVSSSVVFNIVNPKGRKSYPSGPVLEKILAIENDGGQVSAEWLMRGRGDIFLPNNDGSDKNEPDLYKSIVELTSVVRKLQVEFAEFKKTSIK